MYNSNIIPYDFIIKTFSSLIDIFNIKDTSADNLLKELINTKANTT